MKKLPIIILLSAAGITGAAFAQTSSGSMDGASSYGTNGASGTSTTTSTTKRVTRSPAPEDASTEIGGQLGDYGKTGGASGSKVSRTPGTNGSSMGTNGSSMGTTTSGQVMWTCPSGYTLSTATRDGSPLCYPSSGPVPGVSR